MRGMVRRVGGGVVRAVVVAEGIVVGDRARASFSLEGYVLKRRRLVVDDGRFK